MDDSATILLKRELRLKDQLIFGVVTGFLEAPLYWWMDESRSPFLQEWKVGDLQLQQIL